MNKDRTPLRFRSHSRSPFLPLAMGVLGALGGGAGCGPLDDPAQPGNESPVGAEETTAGLNGGTLTMARGEIGKLTLGGCDGGFCCTGTLVDPRHIITAAHCIDYKTGPNRSTFRYVNNAGVASSAVHDRAYSLGRDLGTGDVALLRLVAPITDATPASIASRPPEGGTTVTAFGFGCQDRGSGVDPMSKQFLTYSNGQRTSVNCPGDSGGPRVIGTERGGGEIFQINSGFNRGSGGDINADAVNIGLPGLTAVQRLGDSQVSNAFQDDFAGFSQAAGVKAVSGDFDNDGMLDLALVGNPGWNTIPVAFGKGDGTFRVTNAMATGFPGWAASATGVVAGDFDDDGNDDIALTGGRGWNTLPVAFSNGDGTFRMTNTAVPDFAGWGQDVGARPTAGDFDADGADDIALTGVSSWRTVPIAFSQRNGSFRTTNVWNAEMASWSPTSGAQTVAGDFDKDGDDDLAFAGGRGWTTIPVGSSQRDGSFVLTNRSSRHFHSWASTAGARLVAGDFDGDGDADLALAGGRDWATVAFAFSNRNGDFEPGNLPLADFPGWAGDARFVLAGHVDRGSNQADLVLLGGPGWRTVPVTRLRR
jgi:hypothetical protein